MENKINIGITGTGSLIGQAVIKSILRSNVNEKLNLIGFDYFDKTVGSFWCSSNFILPDILKNEVTEKDLVNYILEIIIIHDIKLLFIGVDFELPIFAKYKEQIEQKSSCKVMVSSSSVIEIANDKYLTYQFLKDNHLNYPQSCLPQEYNSSEFKFPLIVKPRKGARSVGVNLVKDSDELQKAVETVKEPVIQEHLGSMESEYTCGTIFLDNELKHIIPLKRYLKQGNTYISYFEKSFPDLIYNYLKDVCAILKPFGACNFQLRIDENGLPKIFEINSRHSGTTYIRSLFGYNEVEYIINYILFNKEIKFNLKEGTVVRYYDEFFIPKSNS